jgi:hypothetical protein
MPIYDSKLEEVTDARWELVDLAITLFIRKYPLHWRVFQRELREQRTAYNVGTGDLEKSSFRNTLSFPIVLRRATAFEIETGSADEDGNVEVKSLYAILEKIIPGFTAPNIAGFDNKLYKEFIRRYKTILLAPEKY